jgi:hypothetical protein
MDIKGKRLVTGAQGTAASNERLDWFAKASSFQMGANCDTAAIRAEARENNLKFGTPDDDNCPNPADSNKDGDATLPNPHNFSNNPGFMGSSTSSALMSAGPRPGVGLGSGMRRPVANPIRSVGPMRPTGPSRPPSSPVGGPVIGRSPSPGRGSVGMPAPGDTDPISEGGPMGRTTGRSGA